MSLTESPFLAQESSFDYMFGNHQSVFEDRSVRTMTKSWEGLLIQHYKVLEDWNIGPQYHQKTKRLLQMLQGVGEMTLAHLTQGSPVRRLSVIKKVPLNAGVFVCIPAMTAYYVTLAEGAVAQLTTYGSEQDLSGDTCPFHDLIESA